MFKSYSTENQCIKGVKMNKILNYLLTFLLKRIKVVYREYWTSKQISQIDSIIYKLKYIIDN